MTPAKKKPWLCSRRAFLGGLGAVGFSHLLPGRSAQAQPGARKRFVAIYVPEGMWAGADRPAPGATTLGSIFGPMDPFRSKITALDGFDLATAVADRPGVDEHHRLPHLLGCTKMVDGRTGGGPTIDQKIAKVIGANSTFESLQFGVQIVYKDGSGRLIWKARGEQLPAMEDPWQAYARIFGGGMAPPAQPGQPAASPAPSSICARARSTTRWVRSPACNHAWRRAIGCAWSRTRTRCATSKSGCRDFRVADGRWRQPGGRRRLYASGRWRADGSQGQGELPEDRAAADGPDGRVSSVRHHQRRQPAVSATRSTSAPIPGWGSAGAGTTCPTAATGPTSRRSTSGTPSSSPISWASCRPCRKAPAPCSTTRSCSGSPSSATARHTA